MALVFEEVFEHVNIYCSIVSRVDMTVEWDEIVRGAKKTVGQHLIETNNRQSEGEVFDFRELRTTSYDSWHQPSSNLLRTLFYHFLWHSSVSPHNSEETPRVWKGNGETCPSLQQTCFIYLVEYPSCETYCERYHEEQTNKKRERSKNNYTGSPKTMWFWWECDSVIDSCLRINACPKMLFRHLMENSDLTIRTVPGLTHGLTVFPLDYYIYFWNII